MWREYALWIRSCIGSAHECFGELSAAARRAYNNAGMAEVAMVLGYIGPMDPTVTLEPESNFHLALSSYIGFIV